MTAPGAGLRGRTVLAVDIGASSGRMVLGTFDGRAVALTEIHRFANHPVTGAGGLLRWDLTALWGEVCDGLARSATLGPVDAVGVDCFGLDYGFLDASGRIVDDPVSHRDPRTRGVVAVAAARVGQQRLYEETGIQLLEGNAVYQLMTDDHDRLARAARLLMIPDLFHHLLSGSDVAEHTAVTTSGAYDVRHRQWATGLLEDLGVPTSFLPEVVEAGTDLGPILPAIADASAFRHTRVIAPASHDTASAVVSTPIDDPDAGYISSGTWSLVGIETPVPIVTDTARTANLSNEGGFGGTSRLLRNCGGLWLLQECRRHWRAEGTEYGYPELIALARTSPGWRSVVNVEHPDFAAPGDMPARIRRYCQRTGQPVPATVAETVRCILDSLALGYRRVLEDVAAVTGRRVPIVHVVGGGSRNRLLNQLTADATGRAVISGPTEASALGNALVQLHALGELGGLEDMRDVARSAEPIERFSPSHDSGADDAYARTRTHIESELAAADVAC